MRKNHLMVIVLIGMLVGVLFGSPVVVSAGEKPEPVVIAAMVYGKHNVSTLDGFKEGMKEKGYIEGRNISYFFDGPYQKQKDLSSGMAKVMAHNPDLIFAATTPVALAAKKATGKKKVPVVFGPVNDPVHAGIVKELKRPGDNITGVMLTDSTAKQLEWALRIAPGIKTIILPYNPNDQSSLLSLQKVREAAGLFGLDLMIRETRNHEEIDGLLANFPDGIDTIFLPRDGMIMSQVEDFAKVANQKRIVLSSTRLEMAERGALFGFGFSGFELGRQMSRLADLILQGRNPGDLPVETAEDYLSINLKTANAIGLTINEHILRQAHTIIRSE